MPEPDKAQVVVDGKPVVKKAGRIKLNKNVKILVVVLVAVILSLVLWLTVIHKKSKPLPEHITDTGTHHTLTKVFELKLPSSQK